ncbi:hypothetical protein EAX61_00350 [Dokdonia sinensis]|uniref:Lipoprotein n=1 Tax=Dokdonia sinensis TaxID=2479847 RepID=A0A3M0GMC7_9FLAO|nr:hypothetical protein [Dokdonia sinensis]RMB63872.1 hypothetical protein EAX61_00350 [Dokdonia sinensis]
MRIKYLLLLVGCFIVLACNNDDDNPQEPIDQLPPITQTGEQTLGCLINGEPFIPSGFGNSAPRAFYQFVDGTYTLGISGRAGGGDNLRGLGIGAVEVSDIFEGQYELTEEEIGNFFGDLTIGGFFNFNEATTTANPGKLIITKLDTSNFIVSGTFEFTVSNDEGETYEVTEGRFDLNYTN